jgi:hypothetical protein
MKIHMTPLNKRTFIRWKIYFDRSRMYIGYIQFFLIAYVFLKDFKGGHLGGLIFKYAIISIPIALVLFVFLSLLLGYIDTKLGFRQEEFRNLSNSNPVMVEMLDSLKEIKEKVNSLNDKVNKNAL